MDIRSVKFWGYARLLLLVSVLLLVLNGQLRSWAMAVTLGLSFIAQTVHIVLSRREAGWAGRRSQYVGIVLTSLLFVAVITELI
ncbi:MAG TPA: hypothetical protein PKA10_00155 [Selenomonadales bacterium]|nr:hypothetical protein [Selenomonadales bacterium]